MSLTALTFRVEALHLLLSVMATIGGRFSRFCRKIFLNWKRRKDNYEFFLTILPIWLRPYTAYLSINMVDTGVVFMAFGYFFFVSLRDIISCRPSIRYALAIWNRYSSSALCLWIGDI